MKRVFVAAFALISMSASAQKGSVLLYGNVGFTSDKAAGVSGSSNTWSIKPGIGYQFNNNWTAGLNLGVAGEKWNDASGTKVTDYNVGPFVRYTKGLSNIFSLFGQLNAGFMGSKVTTSNPSASFKTTGFGADFSPNVGVNVSKGFALNFGFGGIGFNTQKVKGSSGSSNHFELTFGQQVNVGVSKNFGGNRK